MMIIKIVVVMIMMTKTALMVIYDHYKHTTK